MQCLWVFSRTQTALWKKVRSLQSGWNLTPIYFRRPERPLSVAVSNCDLTSRLLLSARLYDAAPLCTDSTTAQAWPAPQEMLNSRCRRTAFSIYGRSHSARLAGTAAEFSRLPRDRYGSWPSAAIGRGRVGLWTKRTFCKWGKVHSRFFFHGQVVAENDCRHATSHIAGCAVKQIALPPLEAVPYICARSGERPPKRCQRCSWVEDVLSAEIF